MLVGARSKTVGRSPPLRRAPPGLAVAVEGERVTLPGPSGRRVRDEPEIERLAPTSEDRVDPPDPPSTRRRVEPEER